MNYRFIVTGGGTSGHINPALTIAGCLKDRCDANGDTCEIKFTGRAQGLEGELVPKAGYDFINVEAKPVPLKPSPKIFAAIKALQKGTKQCKSLIEEFSPDAVVSTGGYVSAPLLRAAKKTKTPIVIHESNAFPGRANKLYAKGAELVLTGFPDENGDFSKAKRVVCVGNPVRPQMFSHTTEDARKELDLAGEDKLVFAMGGSLGAATITNFVVGAAKDFPDVKFVLSCGKHNAVELPKDLPANLEIKDYIDNPDVYLSAADVCILRAGAVTCAELCATGACGILIPYPYAAHDHQTYNAKTIAAKGGCEVISDNDVKEGMLTHVLKELLSDKEKREQMRKAARAQAIENTTDLIADEVFKAIGKIN